MQKINELKSQLITESDGGLDKSVYKEFLARKAKALQFERILNESLKSGDLEIVMDTVKVKGKPVGKISINLDDFDSGINFTTLDKSFSKEFDSIKSLVQFLETQYAANQEQVG